MKLEMSIDKKGQLSTAYFQIREGKVVKTTELQIGVINADYDARGVLLGIELLGPCEIVQNKAS